MVVRVISVVFFSFERTSKKAASVAEAVSLNLPLTLEHITPLGKLPSL